MSASTFMHLCVHIVCLCVCVDVVSVFMLCLCPCCVCVHVCLCLCVCIHVVSASTLCVCVSVYPESVSSSFLHPLPSHCIHNNGSNRSVSQNNSSHQAPLRWTRHTVYYKLCLVLSVTQQQLCITLLITEHVIKHWSFRAMFDGRTRVSPAVLRMWYHPPWFDLKRRDTYIHQIIWSCVPWNLAAQWHNMSWRQPWYQLLVNTGSWYNGCSRQQNLQFKVHTLSESQDSGCQQKSKTAQTIFTEKSVPMFRDIFIHGRE